MGRTRLLALAVTLLVAMVVACARGPTPPSPAPSAPAASGTAVTPLPTPAGTPGEAAPAATETAAATTPAEGVVGTAMAVAAEPGPPIVVLDPGHGGDEVGAADHEVVEKESNLDLALRVEAVLQGTGLRVVLTRRDDARATPPPGFEPAPGASVRPARVDVQARIDIANLSGAAVFVSIHSNGSTDSGLRGIEVYYSGAHEHAERARTLGAHMLGRTLEELATAGYAVADRGVKDDHCIYSRGGTCRGIFVISPPRVTRLEDLLGRGIDPARAGLLPGETEVATRATLMPAALIELLFVSNARDAAILADEAARAAMARGVATGILDYLAAEGLWPAKAE